ncbi:MAG: hypothetical protein U9N02_05015 [Campylobacterota bacterium]|nr:hypothetical protein [Campylobacterota bacterium]
MDITQFTQALSKSLEKLKLKEKSEINFKLLQQYKSVANYSSIVL